MKWSESGPVLYENDIHDSFGPKISLESKTKSKGLLKFYCDAAAEIVSHLLVNQNCVRVKWNTMSGRFPLSVLITRKFFF